jgi:hypothetical protein
MMDGVEWLAAGTFDAARPLTLRRGSFAQEADVRRVWPGTFTNLFS